MKFRLYFGFNNGVSIPKDKIRLTAPLAGELFVEEWPYNRDVVVDPRRHRRVALFKEFGGGCSIPREIHKPLFDPVVVKITKKYMELTGIEINVIDGQTVKHMQSWILLPYAEPVA